MTEHPNATEHDDHGQDALAAFTNGLSALAGWLTEHEITPPRTGKRIIHPLHTNSAVAEFATRYGLPVVYDAEGNASASIAFGPISYQAYGYVDFDEHCRTHAERDARAYAAANGVALVPADQPADQPTHEVRPAPAG
jgi:hypothetical protein